MRLSPVLGDLGQQMFDATWDYQRWAERWRKSYCPRDNPYRNNRTNRVETDAEMIALQLRLIRRLNDITSAELALYAQEIAERS